MSENLRVGRIIHGETDAKSLQDGMTIVFEKSLTPLLETDMLVVEMTSGEIVLHVLENDGDSIAVSGPAPGQGNWHFHLDKKQGNTWVVRLEPQHIELLELLGRRQPK